MNDLIMLCGNFYSKREEERQEERMKGSIKWKNKEEPKPQTYKMVTNMYLFRFH